MQPNAGIALPYVSTCVMLSVYTGHCSCSLHVHEQLCFLDVNIRISVKLENQPVPLVAFGYCPMTFHSAVRLSGQLRLAGVVLLSLLPRHPSTQRNHFQSYCCQQTDVIGPQKRKKKKTMGESNICEIQQEEKKANLDNSLCRSCSQRRQPRVQLLLHNR